MKRREFLKSLGDAAAWSLAAELITISLPIVTWGQAAEKTRRVGVLFSGLSSGPGARPVVLQALVDGLREHGWEEGRNVVLEVRYAGGDPARFAELAVDLVELKVDAIMINDTQALDAARRKTTTIPIILTGQRVTMGLGFIESLARPGGNITGVVNQAETVDEKNLELFKEINPGIERIGIMYSPENSASFATFKKEQMVPRLGLIGVPIPVSKPGDLDEAFATIVRERVQALHVHPVPVIVAQRGRVAAFAIERRLPTTCGANDMARDGLLMSYGFDPRVSWRRAASYVDRIFKGANPAEIPVEQMDRFQLIINLRTARAIGLDLPPALVARADEVIE